MNNPHAEATFRFHYRKYVPVAAVLLSESLIAGTASPAFNQHVDDDLGVAGGWMSDTEEVLTVIIQVAKTWQIVEALKRRNGTPKVVAWMNDSTVAGKSKERTEEEESKDSKEVTC